jgi:hypothetical protein
MGDVAQLVYDKESEIEVGQLYRRTTEGRQRIVESIDVTSDLTIGEGQRRLTFRCMIDRGLPLAEQQKTLQDMLSLGDHAKATYELQDAMMQLPLHELAVKQAQENAQRCGEKNKARLELIKVEIDALRLDAVAIKDRHVAEFRKSGRRGEYRPSGAEQNEINAAMVEIDKLEAEQQRLREEDGGALNGAMTQLAQARQNLALCKEAIAKRRQVLGLPTE